jgi:hypothetical protein
MKTQRTPLLLVMVLSSSSALLAGCGELGADVAPVEGAASPKPYGFTKLATIGDDAPGGGTYSFDFEPGGLNGRGDFTYAADVSTGGEGVFKGSSASSVTQILRSGQPAPGGGVLGPFGILGHASVNDGGDMSFAFNGDPFTLPLGFNSGVYHFAANTGTTSAIVVPFVTPAPSGGAFQGAVIHAALNNGGDTVFAGIINTTAGIASPPSPPDFGLGVGVFLSDRKGALTGVAVPGDPAPGGCAFDFAQNPSINDAGAVAFGAHIACDPCNDFGTAQTDRIICAESIYLRQAPSGQIVSIAHQGDPAPGGGVFNLAFGPMLNSRGDIVFIGDLGTDPEGIGPTGVFVFTRGQLQAVARPGDAMPGGGHFASASTLIQNYSINNKGDIAFNASLDTSTDGIADTGLYVFSSGAFRLVARTGTVIPGVGTVSRLHNNPFIEIPSSGAIMNERGQVLFGALLADGSSVLLLATP